jgi:CheY-like chemotaxis protein
METLRVLVVDDETGMRMAIARVLSTFTVRAGDDESAIGFEVKTAETGEEALERIAESVPDILLLDLKLPGISGLDVLRQVRDRALPTLTVMITAYATLETAIEAPPTPRSRRRSKRPSRAPTTSCLSLSRPTSFASPSGASSST